MASGEIGEIMTFVEGLMSTESGLNNRAQYGFVELVAWLHEQSLAPFTINTSVPRPNQRWTSALFGPFGELSGPQRPSSFFYPVPDLVPSSGRAVVELVAPSRPWPSGP